MLWKPHHCQGLWKLEFRKPLRGKLSPFYQSIFPLFSIWHITMRKVQYVSSPQPIAKKHLSPPTKVSKQPVESAPDSRGGARRGNPKGPIPDASRQYRQSVGWCASVRGNMLSLFDAFHNFGGKGAVPCTGVWVANWGVRSSGPEVPRWKLLPLAHMLGVAEMFGELLREVFRCAAKDLGI